MEPAAIVAIVVVVAAVPLGARRGVAVGPIGL
jgi:hypothetical protein